MAAVNESILRGGGGGAITNPSISNSELKRKSASKIILSF
jgi:hypothetical protein